jgi:hypothetical protein
MMSLQDANVDRLPYTAKEKEIFDLMARARKRNRAIDSTEIMKTVYRGQTRLPKNARIIVGGLLNTLKRKMDRNRERYVLAKSGRRGPHPMSWELRPRTTHRER